MKIYLSAKMKISDLNRKFRRMFPYLKIEMVKYDTAEEVYTGFYQDSLCLLDAAGVMKEGEITIDPELTVQELISYLHDRHLLPAHIFRKTMTGWSDTSRTAYLMLYKQNELGAQSFRASRNYQGTN